MKIEKIYDAIGLVDDDLISDAENIVIKQKKKKWWIPTVAAGLAAAIVLCAIFLPDSKNNGFTISPVNLTAYAIKEAEYPECVAYPDEQSENYFEEEKHWRQYREQLEGGYNSDMNTDAFFKNSFQAFLKDSDGENKVYSPLNIYFTLGMLAELTEGNTRKEILDVLSEKSIDELRKKANAIWRANYYDDQRITSILSSSLWLNENLSFNEKTLERIADTYYASSYKGKMGSEEFNSALVSWLNSSTKNLLKQETNEIFMTKYTALAVASTIYFKAAWEFEFNKIATKKETFYLENGTTEKDFMKMSRQNTAVYYGDGFTAARLSLKGSGYMYFILPDKGISTEKVLSGSDAVELVIKGDAFKNKREGMVNFSIPKFDATAQFDLTKELKKLGINDAFSRLKADFTPISEENLFVSKAKHAARVMIDEEGCTGAAYTAMTVDGMSARPDEIIDFNVNRPFIFAVTSATKDVLFAGVINNP